MSRLEPLIRARIVEHGPITVAEFMTLALGHAEHGYYMRGDPFGTEGDFITAPEISQIFGELIGLWAAVTWQQMEQPGRTILVECGPGRGTLMNDLIRAAKAVPDFHASLEVHLVETSPALRDRQQQSLDGISPVWHDRLDTVPEGPTLLIANEFLDALPVHHFVKTETGWAERLITTDGDGFTFVVGERNPVSGPSVPADFQNAKPGEVREVCPAALEIADQVSDRLSAAPGGALFIDYGHDRSGLGETLQAVQAHRYADPLANPGEADLTAHVDFEAFADRIRGNGHQAFGPVSQAAFLDALGIDQRTADLANGATQEQAAMIRRGSDRLTNPDQMGTLFRVMVASRQEAPTPAGFEAWVNEQC